jgi:excisionase family DNA binding protein
VDQLLTVTQAAAILGVSGARVRQMVDEGKLREVGRAGTAILLHRAEVERLAAERQARRERRRRGSSGSVSD